MTEDLCAEDGPRPIFDGWLWGVVVAFLTVAIFASGVAVVSALFLVR